MFDPENVTLWRVEERCGWMENEKGEVDDPAQEYVNAKDYRALLSAYLEAKKVIHTRKPLKVKTVRRAIYAPGQQPAFPDGLYAEELLFPEGIPDPSRIEAVWDAGTQTMRLFIKDSPQQ